MDTTIHEDLAARELRVGPFTLELLEEGRSSVVRALGYDDEGAFLLVQLMDRERRPTGLYRYVAVPEFQHVALAEAESMGQYLNAEIKPCYHCEQYDEATGRWYAAEARGGKREACAPPEPHVFRGGAQGGRCEECGRREDDYLVHFDAVWKYKDGERYWWRVTLRRTGERPAAGHEPEDGSTDGEWRYDVTREDGGEWHPVYAGQIVGQYEEQPTLEEVLDDFAAYVMRAAIGFARWEGGKDGN